MDTDEDKRNAHFICVNPCFICGNNSFFVFPPITHRSAAAARSDISFAASAAPFGASNAAFSFVNGSFRAVDAAFSWVNAGFSFVNAPFSPAKAAFALVDESFAAVNAAFEVTGESCAALSSASASRGGCFTRAGAPDPADPAHFTIRYDLRNGTGIIDGRLKEEGGTVTLKIIAGPAMGTNWAIERVSH